MPQNTSKQARSVLLKRTHLQQEAPADEICWRMSFSHTEQTLGFSEICDLSGTPPPVSPSVKLTISETESRAFYFQAENIVFGREYSPVAPSI